MTHLYIFVANKVKRQKINIPQNSTFYIILFQKVQKIANI